ncbi:enoyl-CoA hydratase-related protein [Rhodococcus sp. NPDC057014]|uniref:enoyl-CoA hydratase-related protein n=1 Tax=Rhodococcus sp. NPDC057014 TaxID=3346000 RepID=UPI00363D502F
MASTVQTGNRRRQRCRGHWGLELALACDFLIASERARFADTHARVGVVPSGGLTARLPLAVGRGFARRMRLSCDFVGAAEALRVGLVTQVVKSVSHVDEVTCGT